MRLESGDTLLVLLCPAWKKQRTAWNLGDDADTTGAICGQLAGAFWGESQIPDSLRSGLARRDMIEEALAGILDR
jgi:ADP-ribosylglycohydrolase